MWFDQAEFDLRCEWGYQGIVQLAPTSRVIVIVDVMSFSTCVDIAVGQGAIVFPYRWKDESAQTYARSLNATLAAPKRDYYQPSLSPASLTSLALGTRLVLPSQNGAVLSLQTGNVPTFAGYLRNCQAIAAHVQHYQTGISVIPAGEQWTDGSLRPALEDWIGAGAILSCLEGTRSPEAEAAIAVFRSVQNRLEAAIQQCSSGKELTGRGFAQDVALAAAFNQSRCVSHLMDNAYSQFVA